MKKTSLSIAGVLLILGGTVWCFQGIGVLPGSFMTGSTFWAIAGVAAAMVGIIFLRLARREP